MKENEYKVIKQEFEHLTAKRDRLKDIKEKMNKLEKNDVVKEYMELYKKYTSATSNALDDDLEKKDDYDLVDRVTRYNSITPTTDIYFYVGSAKKDKDGYIEVVDAKNDKADFYKFYNIEEKNSVRYISVIPSKLPEFTAKNIVVYPSVLRNCELCFTYASTEYFLLALNEGQDVAIQKFKEYAKKCYPWKTGL